jgi:hypothetical protein
MEIFKLKFIQGFLSGQEDWKTIETKKLKR